MIQKKILFGGHRILACDGRCNKAWGINGRPRDQFDEYEPDDYVYTGDNELGVAPGPGETVILSEGDHMKPSAVEHKNPELLNKWCVRECERSTIVGHNEPIELPDMNSPTPNMPHRRGRR